MKEFGMSSAIMRRVRKLNMRFTCTGANCPFLTLKERDNETGLDYFVSRYYSSAQGRFTSADSLLGKRVNPQSLNRYAYVLNNPLRFIDSLGYQAQDPRGEEVYDRVIINILEPGKKPKPEPKPEPSFLDLQVFSAGQLCTTGRCGGTTLRQAGRQAMDFLTRETNRAENKIRSLMPDGIKVSCSVFWVTADYTITPDFDVFGGLDAGSLIGGAPADRFEGKGFGLSLTGTYIANAGTRDSEFRVLWGDQSARLARATFFTGPSLGVQACYYLCGGLQNSGTQYAGVFGAGTPSFSMGPSYGRYLFHIPVEKLPKLNIPR